MYGKFYYSCGFIMLAYPNVLKTVALQGLSNEALKWCINMYRSLITSCNGAAAAVSENMENIYLNVFQARHFFAIINMLNDLWNLYSVSYLINL